MSNKSQLLAKIFDEKIVSVLSVLLQKKGEFGVRELARDANISTATTYRIIQKFKGLGLLAKVRHGKSIFYKVKQSSKVYEQIHGLIAGPKPGAVETLRRQLDSKVGAENYRLLIRGKGKKKKIFVVSDKITASTHSDISKTIEKKTGKKLKFACISSQQL